MYEFYDDFPDGDLGHLEDYQSTLSVKAPIKIKFTRFIRESDKAYLVAIGTNDVWFPKKHCTVKKDALEVVCPVWLYDKKVSENQLKSTSSNLHETRVSSRDDVPTTAHETIDSCTDDELLTTLDTKRFGVNNDKDLACYLMCESFESRMDVVHAGALSLTARIVERYRHVLEENKKLRSKNALLLSDRVNLRKQISQQEDYEDF